jgi:hypothetical protein
MALEKFSATHDATRGLRARRSAATMYRRVTALWLSSAITRPSSSRAQGFASMRRALSPDARLPGRAP